MKLKQVGQIPNFYINEESGIYYVRKRVNGTTVDRSTGFRSQKSAYDKYLEIMGELADVKAGWQNKRVPTVAEWWKTYRQAKVKSDSTWAQEEKNMKANTLPEFGRMYLTSITRSDVEKWANRLRKKLSDSTVTLHIKQFQALLQAAVDDELLTANPAKKAYRSAYKGRNQVLSVEHQDIVYAAMRPSEQRWLTFMLGTGLRVSEAYQLNPGSVDAARMVIRVKGKGHMGKPRYREVPLLDSSLVGIIAEQIQEKEKVGNAPVLWARSPRGWGLRLLRLCAAAKIPTFSPHVLRHTFATRYLQSGGDIYVLSKILGHSSVSVTEHVYAHLLTPDLVKLSKHVQLELPGSAKEGKVLTFNR